MVRLRCLVLAAHASVPEEHLSVDADRAELMRRVWLEDHILDRFVMSDKFCERLHRLLDHFCGLQIVTDLFNLPRWLLGFLVPPLLELGCRGHHLLRLALLIVRVTRVILAVFGLLVGRLETTVRLPAARDARVRVARAAALLLIATWPNPGARVLTGGPSPAIARTFIVDALLSQEILDVPQQDLLVLASAGDNGSSRAPGQGIIGHSLVTLQYQVRRVRSHLEFVLDRALRDYVPQVDFPAVRLGRYKPPILVPDPQAIYLYRHHERVNTQTDQMASTMAGLAAIKASLTSPGCTMTF